MGQAGGRVGLATRDDGAEPGARTDSCGGARLPADASENNGPTGTSGDTFLLPPFDGPLTIL